jgi:hypothetical protein
MEIMFPHNTATPKFRVDIKLLPELSLKSLCQQAVNHRMSNMVDANANNWIRVERLGEKGTNAKDATPSEKAFIKDRITQWRTDHKDEYEAKKAELQEDAWKEILEGFELGGRGPRVDPVTREYNALVLKRAQSRFAEVSTAEFPKPGETALLKNGKSISREAMIELTENRYGEELMTRANAIVDARNAKTEAVEPAGSDEF